MGWISIFKRNGQSTAEYAILIGLVVTVAVAMQTYVKRGLQGRIQGASDKLYDGITTANWNTISTTPTTTLSSKQYEPEGLSSQSTQEVKKDEQISDMAAGGTVTRKSTRITKQAEGDFQQYDVP